MKRLPGKVVTTLSFSAVAIAALVLAAQISLARQSSSSAAKIPSAMEPVPALTPFVDGHTHFDEKDIPATIRTSLAALGRENAAMIFLQMPPDIFDHPGRYDAEIVLSAAKKYPAAAELSTP
jgi:hypothetical protein